MLVDFVQFYKKQAGTDQWKDKIDQVVLCMIQEVIVEVRKEDPVKREWNMRRNQEWVTWCNACSLALGALSEIGVTAEDAACLRKKDNSAHINVAELNATMKGINLALKWGLQAVEIRMDSATVVSWIKSEVLGDKRIRTKGAAKMSTWDTWRFDQRIWAKNNHHISSIAEKQGRHADWSEEGLTTGEERHSSGVLCRRRSERPL